MWLRKENAGAASTGHTWGHDGAVVQVPDRQAAELLALSAEFSEVDPPAETPEPSEPDTDGEATPKRRGRAAKTPVDETGE